mmetsp:Transcript_34182/g.84621  ORF Transcript_34182/g.84621 Transcript_34182/m.84621 type:complete len:200 (+) Transcript_34182:1304-1903(+)
MDTRWAGNEGKAGPFKTRLPVSSLPLSKSTRHTCPHAHTHMHSPTPHASDFFSMVCREAVVIMVGYRRGDGHSDSANVGEADVGTTPSHPHCPHRRHHTRPNNITRGPKNCTPRKEMKGGHLSRSLAAPPAGEPPQQTFALLLDAVRNVGRWKRRQSQVEQQRFAGDRLYGWRKGIQIASLDSGSCCCCCGGSSSSRGR